MLGVRSSLLAVFLWGGELFYLDCSAAVLNLLFRLQKRVETYVSSTSPSLEQHGVFEYIYIDRYRCTHMRVFHRTLEHKSFVIQLRFPQSF